MAWEENPRICLHMQLIAILSRTGVIYCSLVSLKSISPIQRPHYFSSSYAFKFEKMSYYSFQGKGEPKRTPSPHLFSQHRSMEA